MSLSIAKVTTNLIPNECQTVYATLSDDFSGDIYCGVFAAGFLQDEPSPAKQNQNVITVSNVVKTGPNTATCEVVSSLEISVALIFVAEACK